MIRAYKLFNDEAIVEDIKYGVCVHSNKSLHKSKRCRRLSNLSYFGLWTYNFGGAMLTRISRLQ